MAKTRKRTDVLKLASISVVDSPAQDNAVATMIVKRRLTADEVAKAAEKLDAEDAGDGGRDEASEGEAPLTEADQKALHSHYAQMAAQHAQDASYHAASGRLDQSAASTKLAQQAHRSAKRVLAMPIAKRDFTQDQRDAAAKTGAAMPDGSFPIANSGDLHNAMRAIGRANDPEAVKAHIRSRAKALGLESELSDAFKKSNDAGDGATHGDDAMPLTEAQVIELQKKNVELEKSLARAQRLAEMTDAEKDYAKTLLESERESFVNAESTARVAAVRKAREADSVVYTCKATGKEFRKSSDPDAVAMAKALDESNERTAKAELESENVAFAKRAADLPNLPGTVDEKVVLLKTVEGRMKPDAKQADRNAQILKAASQALAPAFQRAGTTGGADLSKAGGFAVDKVAELAKDYAKTHSVTIEVAKSRVLKTPEGQRLYKEYEDEKRAALAS